MKSIHLQLPDDLYDRVDKAIGDIPRNRWIRRAIERALDAQPEFVPASTHNALAEAARQEPNEGGTLIRSVAEFREKFGPPARSSSQSKRDVRPIPKGGKS